MGLGECPRPKILPKSNWAWGGYKWAWGLTERLTPCPAFTGPGGSSCGDGESCHGQDLKSRKLCLPTGLESTDIGSLPESPVTGLKVLSVTAVLPAAPRPFRC